MPGCCAAIWNKRRGACALVLMLCATSGVAADDAVVEAARGASAYLHISKTNHSRCQALRRGKMYVLHNLHPTRTIRYRMRRLLAGKPQAGLIRDHIAPTDPEDKNSADALGCGLLEGLAQEWSVIQADFAPLTPL